MWMSLSATFQLGIYQGRTPAGDPEPMPTLARLHAALLAAASAAPFAVSSQWGTQAREGDLRAIEWLESHPADAIEPPAIGRPNLRPKAYREKGYRNGKAWAGSTKLPEPAVRAHAFDGPLRWYWELENDNTALAETLDRLAAEVPYLGESASPVRLDVESGRSPGPDALWRSTQLRPIRASGGHTIQSPMPGRARKLTQLHAAQFTKSPSEAADKIKDGEAEEADRYLRELLTTVGYEPKTPPATAPWLTGHLLDVTELESTGPWNPRPEWYVAWAVAVHRALVKKMSPAVPALVSGRYPEGKRPPANRMAIHILPPGLPLAGGASTDGAKILIALPGDASPEDQEAVGRAVQELRWLRRARDAEGIQVNSVDSGIDLVNFWRPLDNEAYERWWMPTPLAIADTRPPAKSARDGSGWNAADTLKLALAFVRRDLFSSAERRDRRLVSLARQVDEAGVRVSAGRRVTPQGIDHYVHKTNANTPVIALAGLLDLSPLGNDRAFMAIGQSRHLGGGLLAPVDFPRGILTDGGVPL